MKPLWRILSAGCLAVSASLSAETPAVQDPKGWFDEARFGLFIHWGPYAVLGGEYQGKPVDGIGEWIQCTARIPIAEYREIAKEFCASEYDPVAWAALARDAGMRYVILTAKHSDGFALYDSQASEWNAVRASKAGRDLIAPLATAMRDAGLHFGLYYSQCQDWTHPGGGNYRPSWDPAQAGDYDHYLNTIAVPQVKEILDLYQPDILWWDAPIAMTRERAHPFIALMQAHPHLISNDRLGGDFPGDTRTPEQHIPPRGYPGQRFEVCMTMNDTWGFKKNDHNWKSTKVLLQTLSDITSKGGNFLLNIGPDAKGRIPEPSVTRLREIGAWMRKNGEAIYGTQAGPFPRRLTWGRVTRRNQPDGAVTLYAHVWEWPSDGKLLLPTMETLPASARVHTTGETITAELASEGVVLRLPVQAPDADVSVLTLDFPSAPVVTQSLIARPAADGSLTLHPLDADLKGNWLGTIYLAGRGEDSYLTGWHHAEWHAEYQVNTPAEGIWRVLGNFKADKPVRLRLQQGESSALGEVPATGGAYQSVQLGTLRLPKGESTLKLLPEKEGWSTISLRTVRLEPIAP